MLDGADVGDPHAVGDQRGGAAAPAADARAAVHDVLHHQEIRRKPHLFDDAQLVLQALHYRFGQVVAVTAPCAGISGLPQELLGRIAAVLDPGRQDHLVAGAA